MNIIDHLEWRYATKAFDPKKTVSKENMDTLKRALQLTPTSLGLQTFHFHIIEDNTLKEHLLPYSFNQQQVTQASHLIVLSYYPEVKEKHVDEIIEIKSTLESLPKEVLSQFKEFVMGYIQRMDKESMAIWSAKQTYIAMGVLLTACAELNIDACPMEGFDANGYNEILNLTEKGLHASLVIPVGYRAEDDKYQHMKKVRRSLQDISTEL
ncbi:NAD(P)H-dependent oxidoreductase [Halosquirtibacter xylanolyticus]|uniref:NAD(P)H-dependent oxidoreductase n=1 Tax=Halosquirtibacter xylanolyticus TaxID=3374599 RepID=UPI0037495B2B|nr:NAD(P)H-dependent oxidoreductase [Prolixibacteraceae bacterium]